VGWSCRSRLTAAASNHNDRRSYIQKQLRDASNHLRGQFIARQASLICFLEKGLLKEKRP
jgi:hypothetical protein